MAPTARNFVNNREEAHKGTGHIEKHLGHVSPDDGSHATFVGVEKRQKDDDGDGGHLAGPQDNGDNDGDRKYSDSFRKGAEDKEKTRGPSPDAGPKADTHELICGVELATEIGGQEKAR